MNEKRLYPRRELNAEALLGTVAGDQWLPVQLLDVSISGAAFMSDERLIVDTVRQIKFILPENLEPIMLRAKIVNRSAFGSGYRIGVHFQQISQAAVTAIQRYVQAAAFQEK